VKRLAKRARSCLIVLRERKRAFSLPPAPRRSASVFRPREIASMSRSRSRNEDGDAMPLGLPDQAERCYAASGTARVRASALASAARMQRLA
jgi:hypothetical protein